ncbi:MAG: hypothetical protein KKC75_02295 [Nanoarchaeota archaeon]|nr:hypothetical protein [Nanoarchaeota archaeon]MBU1004689.1 hypothetical protein [Nanoarchaeota archaeon]MBU1945372.1 hypothetical protein [Nanoarchaeota archaeon]
MDVCIKNINDEDWRAFKAESAKRGMKTGELFGKLLEECTKKPKAGNAKGILFGKKTLKGALTRKEFKDIRGEFRKDFESFN